MFSPMLTSHLQPPLLTATAMVGSLKAHNGILCQSIAPGPEYFETGSTFSDRCCGNFLTFAGVSLSPAPVFAECGKDCTGAPRRRLTAALERLVLRGAQFPYRRRNAF